MNCRRRRVTTSAHVMLLVALLLLGTACGTDRPPGGGADGAPDATGDTTTPEPTTPGPATGPGTPSGRPTGRSTPPSEALQKIRVVGRLVSVGACVAIRDANAISWTLRGARTEGLAVGDWVQVTGAPDLRGEGCGGPVVVVDALEVLDRE
ncbi:hypothetical protein [Nocardioides houyundeii]|uniref:hypothetical protein n=1 Tax=Nocardioides houyundeii TaxID=2045452 RepID=UPI0013B44D85|nr:hypothetical protein [Nocardioides houyundeii]